MITKHRKIKLTYRTPPTSRFSYSLENFNNWSVHANNLAVQGSQEATSPFLLFINQLEARYLIYTVGTASASKLYGLAGMVVIEGYPPKITTLFTR